jgi:hypothetical protein
MCCLCGTTSLTPHQEIKGRPADARTGLVTRGRSMSSVSADQVARIERRLDRCEDEIDQIQALLADARRMNHEQNDFLLRVHMMSEGISRNQTDIRSMLHRDTRYVVCSM